jgi:hypothetical protein
MEGDQARPVHIYSHILHVVVEVADESHTGARNLRDQGPTPLKDGRLVG